MKFGSLPRSAVLVWVNCVIYAIGMIAANYVVGSGAIVIVLVDLAAIAALWLLKFSYRMRFSVLLVSVAILHLAVILRPESQPVANLWLGGLSLILFLISLFLPRSEDTSSRGSSDTDRSY